MIRLIVTAALLAVLWMPVLGAGAARADSYWNHNGSTMRLQAQGNLRWFTYHAPRAGMAAQGVVPGTLLFNGTRIGDRYEGTAQVFSAACAEPLTYFVAGRVIGSDRIVMEGQRPVFSNCRPTGKLTYDRLEFTYISSDPVAAAPPIPPPFQTPGAVPRLDATQAFGLAARTLGEVFVIMTPDQLRLSIRSVTFGPTASVCSGPGVWTVSVTFPELPAYGYGGSGDISFDDASGVMSCTTLPMD